MAINALTIAPDGTVAEHDLSTLPGEYDFQRMGSLVGGYIEGFGTSAPVEDLGLWAYCNEEGWLIDLPENPVASIVCGHVRENAMPPLMGTILFTAPDLYDEETHEETSNPPLSQEQIDGLNALARSAWDTLWANA